MKTLETLNSIDLFVILCGIVMGTIARLITLKVDTRQNPSFPNGYFTNVMMGFIAAGLGAMAIPTLLAKDFAAVTFLALAIQHFRDIRKIEAESLHKLESVEYSKRGAAYIDGIAKTYEARNYHALVTSLITVLILKIFSVENMIINAAIALATGFIVIFTLHYFTKGKHIGDICTLTEGKISFDHSDLYVDGMFVSNMLGTDKSKELFEKEGVAIVVHPNKDKFRLTIENYGQRQAILFEATRSFGVRRYKFTRRNFKEGKLLIAFVPIIRNVGGIMDVIKNTPVLENSRKIHTIMQTQLTGGEDNGR